MIASTGWTTQSSPHVEVAWLVVRTISPGRSHGRTTILVQPNQNTELAQITEIAGPIKSKSIGVWVHRKYHLISCHPPPPCSTLHPILIISRGLETATRPKKKEEPEISLTFPSSLLAMTGNFPCFLISSRTYSHTINVCSGVTRASSEGSGGGDGGSWEYILIRSTTFHGFDRGELPACLVPHGMPWIDRASAI